MATEDIDATRFSVYVPTPKVRLNMGIPQEGGDNGAFGYNGMSLQSDRHLFIDVNKVAIYQSGSHSMWQVGGQWLQYSNANMVMSSTANSMLSADNRVIIAAGAGHGQVTSLDHAQRHVTPRMEPYNNLQLHYRVEESHNGLKRLFYGKNFQTKEGAAQSEQVAGRQNPANGAFLPVPADPQYPAGGLLNKLYTHLDTLGYSKLQNIQLLEPFEWEGDYKEMRNGFHPGKYIGGPGSGKTSVYPAMRVFDPYPSTPYTGWGTELYANFVQTVNFFHRFVDLLRKVMGFVTDNAVTKRLQNLIAIWGAGQDAINSALNFGDLMRWDRSGTGDASGPWAASQDESGNLVARPQSANFDSKKAKLASRTEPFDVGQVDATEQYFDIKDAEGGAAVRVWLSALPATLSVTMSEQVKSLNIAVTDATLGASVTLDGTVVQSVYDAQTQTTTWDALPSGFSWVTQYTLLKRSDDGFFTASSPVNMAVSETVTDTLNVAFDGTTTSVSLAILGASFAGAARATAFAAVVTGGTASASASAVTLTGATLGPTGSVSVSGSSAALARVGLSGTTTAAGEGVATTATAIAARMSGNYAATTGAGQVKLEHNVSGSSSYLEVTGPLASTIWGANPAKSKGKDSNFLTGLDEARVLQYEIAKWPEDVRNLFRPIYQAFMDVMAVYDQIKNIIDNVLAFAGATLSPPSAIGLFAEKGITLGAGGSLYAMGDSVTLVAAPKADADDRKFALGVLEKFFSLDKKWEEPEAWKKEWFKVKKKTTHAGAGYGGFRVVSSQNILLTSVDDARVIALGQASLEGATARVSSNTSTKIACLTDDLSLRGKTVTVGGIAPLGNQLATETVAIAAQNGFSVSTNDCYIGTAGTTIDVGARGAIGVNAALPRLVVTDAKIAMGVGGNAAGVQHGFTALANGKLAISSGMEVSLTGNGVGLKLSNKVEVTGALYVGNTLVVKDTGMVAAAVIPPEVLPPPPEKAVLTSKYAAIMASARVLKLAMDTTGGALLTATFAVTLFPNPLQDLAEHATSDALLEAYRAQRAKLAALGRDRLAILARAVHLHFPLADIGVPNPDTDADVFA